MFRTIVAPLDGSPFGEHALPHACAIATRADATLRLVHVHTSSASPIYVEGQPVVDENLRSLHHRHEQLYLEQIKARLATQLPNLGIEVEAYDRSPESLVSQSVGEFLAAQIAARKDVALMVMTTHGRSGLSRLWLGSVADVLVRTSNAPILLVRPQDGEPAFTQLPRYQRILIPLDGSQLAEQIFEPAQRLGDLMGAQCTLLQVVAPVSVTYGLSTQQLAAINAQATEKARAYLNRVAQEREQGRRHLHRRVLSSDNIAAAILEDAQQYGNDLIAMATHGWSGLRRMLIGSIADKVVRGATLPILLYRPQADQGSS
jgi:nucleotide-binding universal stress UspA family protein